MYVLKYLKVQHLTKCIQLLPVLWTVKLITLDTKHSAMATGSALHFSRSWRRSLKQKSSQQLTLYSRDLHFIPSFVSSLNTHTYKWLSRGSLFQQLCWISRVKSRCSKWGDRPLNKFRTSMNSNREQLLLCSCKFSVGTKRTKETATPEVIVSWLKHEVIVTSFNCFYVSVYWPVWLCGAAEKWIGGSECLCLQTTMTDAGPAISSEYKTHTLKHTVWSGTRGDKHADWDWLYTHTHTH